MKNDLDTLKKRLGEVNDKSKIRGFQLQESNEKC